MKSSKGSQRKNDPVCHPTERKKTVKEDNFVEKAEGSPDVRALKEQIAQLEERIATLEAENQELRIQKSEGSRREQIHNFFKYGNARRY